MSKIITMVSPLIRRGGGGPFISSLRQTLVRKSVVGLNPVCVVHARGYKHHESKLVKELYKRRLEVGPEPWRHRSEFANWNYDAEVFAFGKRLGVDLSDKILKRLFVNKSYVEKESNKRKELGVDDSDLELESNELLIVEGEKNGSDRVKMLLSSIYPSLKEEYIAKIHDVLWADESLAHIGKNLGMTDLILSGESSPEMITLSNTFKAFLGAILVESGSNELELVLKDFVIPELIGKDIGTIVDFKNAMGELSEILEQQGRGLPEPRLLWQSGCNTVLAVYHVGIYSDRKLIGRSPGETVLIAEEEAAKDALKRLYQIEDHRPPLPVDRNSSRSQITQ
ncbi:large ribosomal subunit protein mL44-like [Tubulanus polymorphus]|uniref:large ribosomal subunit protein mL44-like n=1 Tax=Tubulanus polymorphus TaxID=672921 RepID=UPI003DA48C7B